MEGVGTSSTFTDNDVVLEQEFKSVPVTVNVSVAAGLTLTEAVTALHAFALQL